MSPKIHACVRVLPVLFATVTIAACSSPGDLARRVGGVSDPRQLVQALGEPSERLPVGEISCAELVTDPQASLLPRDMCGHREYWTFATAYRGSLVCEVTVYDSSKIRDLFGEAATGDTTRFSANRRKEYQQVKGCTVHDSSFLRW